MDIKYAIVRLLTRYEPLNHFLNWKFLHEYGVELSAEQNRDVNTRIKEAKLKRLTLPEAYGNTKIDILTSTLLEAHLLGIDKNGEYTPDINLHEANIEAEKAKATMQSYLDIVNDVTGSDLISDIACGYDKKINGSEIKMTFSLKSDIVHKSALNQNRKLK